MRQEAIHFIGMNLHKRIFTTYVLNDDMKGLNIPISSDLADDYRMVFENITHAHFVFHYLYRQHHRERSP